jgi:hypothetical protein
MYKNELIKKSGLMRKAVFLSFACLPLLFCGTAHAQDPFKGLEPLFTAPKHYSAIFTANSPIIDGDISDAEWANIPWTDDFTDIEGDKQPAPYYKTRCKLIWDKDYLYIAAVIKDPDVWAYVKNHDQIVFQDNDFEIFIDPLNTTHQYFEIEVNAINTIWDLYLPKAYRNLGSGLSSWESGVRSAVKVQGTLNNPSDKDQGWTVELAIPYRNLNLKKPPVEGDFWRVNFSRVQWVTTVNKGKYIKNKDDAGKNLPEHNWVWSPQGLINMHYPERWGYLTFSTAASGASQQAFDVPYTEKQRNYLWLVYYRQKEYAEKNGKYASSLKDLGIAPEFTLDGKTNALDMEGGDHQFYLSLKSEGQRTVTINQEGLVQVLK